jgi:molybdopterin-guanine dinucleotide biosynthesis protein A
MSTAALILAGGQGTRLGGADKAFVPLHGQPLLDHLLARLAPQTPTIAISANGDATRFAAYGLPVLADDQHFAGQGPLAGVATGLAWAASIGAEFLLTIPVDTPFTPPDLLAALTPGPSVAVYEGRQHHLVSLWPVAFLAGLKTFLGVPSAYKVRDALTLCGARQVAFAGAADPFHNINTPDDLAAAMKG